MRIAAWLFAAAPAFALAQTQVVKPPIAQYWMSVDTAAGMSMPGLGALMPGAMGGAARGGRHLLLQLGSRELASGEPRAEHDIPAGMDMGPSLPLLTPQGAPRAAPGEEQSQGMERPKRRMLIYWGCGEQVRKGQPVVVDFSKLAAGQVPPNLAARRISIALPPAPGRSRTYGEWPNREDAKAVPADASLKGEHVVKGNYSPEIRFSLGEGQDFMQAVALSGTPLGSGAVDVRWKEVPYATGYFAALYGAQREDEVVMWTSSEEQEMGSALMTFIAPAEVARLVRDKVVLAPQTTECAVPAEVVKKAGAPFLSFIAYGPEANFAQPPRPKDPKIPWEPKWTAKVRFKSTASLLLSEGTRSRAA
ncbi:MAG: hypothetical protein M0015_01720, partial [Betaproteobacteria bacterium]|nr:hypothetical protein [Betaproteobacteria bacterium]